MRALVPAGVPVAVAKDRLRLSSYGLAYWNTDGAPGTGGQVRGNATATGSGTAHTMGAWTELIAATSQPADVIWLAMFAASSASGTDSSSLLNIGIGGAGSEQIIVPNVPVGYKLSAAPFPWIYMIPVHIPDGSRVAIQVQSAQTSKQIQITWMLGSLPHGRRAPSKVFSIGADSATSKGVNLSNPGASNTKGAWTEITSATTMPFGALVVGIQGAGSTALQTENDLVDIGIGPAGAEQVLPGGGDFHVRGSNTEAVTGGMPWTIPCRLPAGTRIAARYSSGVSSNPKDISLIGVPA